MSENETKDIKVPTSKKSIDLDNLPENLQKKIEFLIRNPDTTLVRLSDDGKGSISNALLGNLQNIDRTRSVLTDMLNFKTETESVEDFLLNYTEYAKDLNSALELLKEAGKKGLELAALMKNPNEIRDRRLRETIKSTKKAMKKAEEKQDAPVASKETVAKTEEKNETKSKEEVKEEK